MVAVDNSILSKAQTWLDSPIEEAEKAEIRRMMEQEAPDELVDSFYKDLEFGTGGLRGIMGIGSNRMNTYTIGMATQGLANYLKKTYPNEEIKVAIAYDSRNNSPLFGEVTASVFSANGIKVFLFKELRPTPQLSFTVRELGCHAGVVLTASHNPKEYNGFKAYWGDGAQLVPPHDKNVIAEVKAIAGIEAVNFEKNDALVEYLGDEMDDTYLSAIEKNVLAPEEIKQQHDLKIVFSPIHGTGITMVPKILKRIGFTDVTVVEEQATPDGNFPTVVYPNPEEREAMSIALKKAQALDADLVMATDPDSDRVGIAVKNHHGEWQLVNGNQTGSLLIYYLLRKWKENGKLNGNQYVVSTIVTTDLIDKIAAHFGVEAYNTLTGFKWIADLLGKFEGKKEFIGGGEESYGYLVNDFVRDKDAIISCAAIAEMVAYAKAHGKSVFGLLMEMYTQFGMYLESLVSMTKKGKSGAEEIQAMMKNLRKNPPAEINGSKVVRMIDYKSSVEKNLVTGETQAVDLPSSNVLQFFTEDGSKISARPSGTEPKIKFYISVNAPLADEGQFDAVSASLQDRIKGISAAMGL
ncbi:MAG: phospho-sugar mutase [Bacteroidota bacterium]